jgi:hypothetical protein
MRPTDDPVEHSTHLLGTTRSPGKVTFSGHDRNKNWETKKAKGEEGASNTLQGDDPGGFEATYYLTDDGSAPAGQDDFTLWDSFQRLIESTTSGPTPVALSIYHPDLARNHYTHVTNGGIGGMVRDERGGATVKVKYVEYKPPKPKPIRKAQPKASAGVAGVPGADGNAGKPPKPDPNAAAKAELAALLDEARRP